MAGFAVQQGTRLAYVVVPIEGTVTRVKRELVKRNLELKDKNGNKKVVYERQDVLREEPGGYMVYFPRGHVLRFKDINALAHHGLHKRPGFVNLQGLQDPHSPIGKLIHAQDDNMRKGAFEDLKQQVIKLATVKTGKSLLTEKEQIPGKETPVLETY